MKEKSWFSTPSIFEKTKGNPGCTKIQQEVLLEDGVFRINDIKVTNQNGVSLYEMILEELIKNKTPINYTINYETGYKGTPLDNLQVSVAVFFTQYSDLPYQVSTTALGGFDTRNIIVYQDSFGVEWEGIWAVTDAFRIQSSLGYIDVDVDDDNAVAPFTPELTASIGPEYTMNLANGSEIVFRADWSFRDDMHGEPSDDPGRFVQIDSRELINLDIAYHNKIGDWTLGLYGQNITDERYENARLNTNDYILVILSNDIREFGVRFTRKI